MRISTNGTPFNAAQPRSALLLTGHSATMVLQLPLQEPFLDFWQSDPSARAYAMGGVIGLLTQLQQRGLAGPAADVCRDVRLCNISSRCALACTTIVWLLWLGPPASAGDEIRRQPLPAV